MMSKTYFMIVVTIMIGSHAFGQDVSSYLITTNIGAFTTSKNPSSGKGPGIVVGANHFYIDHIDMSYRTSYLNTQTRVGPEVQVTQHAGADSDKWLAHELERDFRNYYGLPGASYAMRVINALPPGYDTMNGT